MTRRSIVLSWLALAALACSAPAPTPAPVPTPIVDPTGILIVSVDDQVQAGPVTSDRADAWTSALMLTESDGDDVGYPWIDPSTGELVLSAATPRGRELIDALELEVPFRIRDVAHGAATLQHIQDDVTFLGSRDVPNAELIFMTLPDHRDNRALIVMSELSRPLLEFLAATYPPDAIAVQIDPDVPQAGL